MIKLAKKIVAVMIAVVCTVGFSVPSFAQGITLEELAKRVEALEKENANLKSRLMAQETKIETVKAAPAAAPAPTSGFLKTKIDTELYGYIKADLVHSGRDMAQTTANTGTTQNNAPRNTVGTANSRDSETQMSGQDTRLGFNFKAPDLDNGGVVTGKIEMDFGAGSNTQGNYYPRMRLAYLQADFGNWAVNAGQNWDFFAPLNTSILNPGALFRQGNLGVRHPQFHLANKWGEFFGGKLSSKIGVIDSEDTLQEDSGLPTAAGYVGYEKTILGVKSAFGVGGMYGRLNIPAKGNAKEDMWATTAGMTLKFTDWLAFKAEGFTGAKLDDYQGGPSTGVTYTSGTASGAVAAKAIPVKGGFIELSYNPFKKVETNYGFGIDDVDEDMADYTAADKAAVWNYNKTYYTNLKYNLSKDLQVGVEYQRFDTRWLDGVRGTDNRVQTSMILKF